MHSFLADLPTHLLILSFAVALFAGLVKGMVGFAMPMILISGLSNFIAPELALAGLILPTLVTNGMQALRQGWAEAVASVVKFRRFLLAGLVTLVAAAQLVAIVPVTWLLLAIGITVTGFAL